jgi:hypothetical protein
MSQLKDQQTGASGDNFTVGGNLVVTGTTVHTGATTFTGAVVMSTALPIASGGTASTSIAANSVMLGNGTSALSANVVAPSTSGNILTSNGTTWVSQTPGESGAFAAGTRIIFVQTSAPTGWTKDTTNYNNHALRVVTGTASTGGSVDFTTAFASGLSAGATTLDISQIPSHTHTTGATNSSPGSGNNGDFAFPGFGSTASGAAGGGGSHTHTIPSFAVKYLDVITATKN